MFVIVDDENKQVFGPFDSAKSAEEFMKDPGPEFDHVPMNEGVFEDTCWVVEVHNIEWPFVEHIEVPDWLELGTDGQARVRGTTPFWLVEDDGTAHGPFDTSREAIEAALKKLTNPEVLVEYRTRANELLFNSSWKFDGGGQAKAIQLISDVDWVIWSEERYRAEFSNPEPEDLMDQATKEHYLDRLENE